VVKFSAQSEHFLLLSLKKGLNISLILRTIYPSRITTFFVSKVEKFYKGISFGNFKKKPKILAIISSVHANFGFIGCTLCTIYHNSTGTTVV